ncbi:MAG: hypothetical protein AB8B49_03625 [Nitratireductor sp.]
MTGIFYLLLITLVLFLFGAFFAFTPAEKLARIYKFAGPIGAIILGSVLTLAGRGIVGLPLLGIGLAWLQRQRTKLK